MTALYDIAAIGNAIVDVIGPADDAFLTAEGMGKGSMALVDEARATQIYERMNREMEASGGSAANTVAGVASFGGSAVFIGKVARDALGDLYVKDMAAIGATFSGAPLVGGAATGRSMIMVTPDGERTMNTFLGAATELTADDVDAALVEASRTLYLEGYLFDPPEARRAFAKAAGLAHGSGRKIALTLSDAFVVDRHRGALLGFIETQVDVLFANEAELMALFETEDFAAALAALRGKVEIAAITRGDRGSVVLTPQDDYVIAVDPVAKVVDTTGAGDQYAAGFLFGLARERSLAQCGALGSLAAAEVISHYGPRPGVSLKALARSRGL